MLNRHALDSMRRWSAVAGLMVLAAGSTLALAQSAPAQGGNDEPARSFNYERRLGGSAKAGSDGGSKSVMLQESTDSDGHRYSLRIEDGKVVSAKVDGKEVPADRIREAGDAFEILDADGKVIYTFQTPASPTTISRPSGSLRFDLQPSQRRRSAGGQLFTAQPGAAAQVEGWTPPPVMLGITMSEPEEDVAEHLGVKAGEVIRIDTVIEGLPAAQAGLKVHDIIVAVDGDKPVNQEKLREILRARKPGDAIKLSIISKGKSEDVVVKLEAYDNDKLGQFGGSVQVAPDQSWWQSFGGDPEELKGLLQERWTQVQPQVNEAKQAIAQALEQLAKMSGESAEKIREEATAALNEALKKLDDHSAAAAQKMSRMGQMLVTPSPSAPALPEGQARPRVYITPMPGAQGDQFDRLTAAVERMEKRLAELESRLEKRQHDAAAEERPRR